MSNSAPSPKTANPLPLVVGVTGHRDLRPEDIPVLEERLGTFFQNLRRQ